MDKVALINDDDIIDGWRDIYIHRPEMDVLISSWVKLLHSAIDGKVEPQFVAILALSGMGKTRLVQKFYEWLVEQESKANQNRYWPVELGRSGAKLSLSPLVNYASRRYPIPFLWGGISLKERLPQKIRKLLAMEPAMAQFIYCLRTQIAEDHGQVVVSYKKTDKTVYLDDELALLTQQLSDFFDRNKRAGVIVPMVLFIDDSECIEQWPIFGHWFYRFLQLAQQNKWPVQIITTHHLDAWHVFSLTRQGVPGWLRQAESIHPGWRQLKISGVKHLPQGVVDLEPLYKLDEIVRKALPGVYADKQQLSCVTGQHSQTERKKFSGWMYCNLGMLCQFIEFCYQPENRVLFVNGSTKNKLVDDWHEVLSQQLDAGMYGNSFLHLAEFIYTDLAEEESFLVEYLLKENIRLPGVILYQFVQILTDRESLDGKIKSILVESILCWLNTGRFTRQLKAPDLTGYQQSLLLRLASDLKVFWPPNEAEVIHCRILAKKWEISLSDGNTGLLEKVATDFFNSLPKRWSFSELPFDRFIRMLSHNNEFSPNNESLSTHLLPEIMKKLIALDANESSQFQWAAYLLEKGRFDQFVLNDTQAALKSVNKARMLCEKLLDGSCSYELLHLRYRIYKALSRESFIKPLAQSIDAYITSLSALEALVAKFGRMSDKKNLLEDYFLFIEYCNDVRSNYQDDEASLKLMDEHCYSISMKGIDLGLDVLKSDFNASQAVYSISDFYQYLIKYHSQKEAYDLAINLAHSNVEVSRLSVYGDLYPEAIQSLAQIHLIKKVPETEQAMTQFKKLYQYQYRRWVDNKNDYTRRELKRVIQRMSAILAAVGNYEEAQGVYKKIFLVINSDEAGFSKALTEYFRLKSLAMLQRKNAIEASSSIMHAIEVFKHWSETATPCYAELLSIYAACQAQGGEWELAQETFKRALDSLEHLKVDFGDPVLNALNNPEKQKKRVMGIVLHHYGIAQASNGFFEQACQTLEKSIAILDKIYSKEEWYLTESRRVLLKARQKFN